MGQVLDRSETATERNSGRGPNILMIVVDDLGYDDTSAINSGGISTPNIQGIAEQGVTFTRHYADATCAPSRVAILTGRYPERSGFRHAGTQIPTEYITLAESLRGVGYSTHLVGKWHAGEDRRSGWPGAQGFDSWFGFLNQWELAGVLTTANKGTQQPTYRNPWLRTDGGELIQHQGHLTDILTNRTVQKLNELKGESRPWFVYHAFLAPHDPIEPAPRYLKQFPTTPEGEYRALITQLDDAIGRLLAAVAEDENTLVLFVSDNGGTNSRRNNNYPFFGKKNETYEGSYRTPLIFSWPGRIPVRQVIDDVVMNVDIYPTLIAATGAVVTKDTDGRNLWPAITAGNKVPMRGRSWEQYNWNVDAMSYSVLSVSSPCPGIYRMLHTPSCPAISTTPAAEETSKGPTSTPIENPYW